LVRTLCREAFNVSEQIDFALHNPARKEDIAQYEEDDARGPDLKELQIDMRGKISSKWNQAVATILVEAVRERKKGEAWEMLPERSDEYIREMVVDQLERARGTWRDA
ncbi:hypothetical protein BDZ97DRAFT_1605120, partial [Flammula alnicola]